MSGVFIMLWDSWLAITSDSSLLTQRIFGRVVSWGLKHSEDTQKARYPLVFSLAEVQSIHTSTIVANSIRARLREKLQ
jgi:hypothetical protein